MLRTLDLNLFALTWRHSAFVLVCLSLAVKAIAQEVDANSLQIFERRIVPIFQSSKPSSCSECHLSGVDLKQYIRPSQQETFASLVAANLIDIEKPDHSKILKFINRMPERASLITNQVRRQEAEAFAAWIRAAVKDPELLKTRDQVVSIGPQVPDEVIRHARQDRVLSSFIENIWTEVGRCAACHSPDQNQKQVKEHGEQVSWITLKNPEATLEYMLAADLIDADNPDQSLILVKPTLQVKHGGGQKMVVGDRTYQQFRRFIDDYAAIKAGTYTAADQLPEPPSEHSVVSEIWLKVEGVPTKFDKMLMQVDLYRKTDQGWTSYRVATSDRPVFGGGNLWQHSLSLTAPVSSPEANEIDRLQLSAGAYLARIYVDQNDKLAKNPTAELSEQDLVGEVEFRSEWRAGYGRMTVIRFPETQ